MRGTIARYKIRQKYDNVARTAAAWWDEFLPKFRGGLLVWLCGCTWVHQHNLNMGIRNKMANSIMTWERKMGTTDPNDASSIRARAERKAQAQTPYLGPASTPHSLAYH